MASNRKGVIRLALLLLLLAGIGVGIYLVQHPAIFAPKATEPSTSAASTLQNGLISYWNFDETSGNIALDYKGLSNGTVVGATIVDGKFNKARNFSALNNIINLNGYPSLPTTGSLSASAWIKLQDKSTSTPIREIVGNPAIWWLDLFNRHPRFILATRDGSSWIGGCTGTTELSLDTWYLITGTYDSYNIKIYLNGILEKTCPASTIIPPTSGHIGGLIGDSSYSFMGIIDDLATWNRALTPGEIQSLMTGPVIQTIVQQPTAQISASPNPCNITSGNTCTSTISWSSQNAPNFKITLKENPGSIFSTNPSGSQAAPWISTSGATFEAYSGSTLLASLFVKGTGGTGVASPSPSPVSGNLTANPNPCNITSGGTCTSVISWSFPAGSDVKIRIKEAPGSLFASGASGSQAAPWISSSGATFQAYVNNILSKELFVKGNGGSTSPTPSAFPHRISANPNPCNLSNGATTCSSSISWSYDSIVEIRIKENPGSLFAKSKSGTQNAPWISASGATFQVYLNNALIDELFVKGIGPSSSPTAKVGDINNDGTVNILDLNYLITDYPSRNLRSDVDHDGDLDIFDVNLLIHNLEL